MQFLLINLSCSPSSVVENQLDEHAFKELAFSAKYKTPVLEYSNVLIPMETYPGSDEDFDMNYSTLAQVVQQKQGIVYNINQFYSVFLVLKDVLQYAKGLSIDILREIDDTQMNIFYTDGSFLKSTGKASYACYQLLNESYTGLLDDFSMKNYDSKNYSGVIEEGTNNIGELTGVKIATQNYGDKLYQVIISDSIYSIKSFREYINVWKENGYRTYSGSPIKNKKLIQEIYKNIMNSNKITLLKWTKGHAMNTFNTQCDKLAKKELGVDD